jgi:hypothetical protein
LPLDELLDGLGQLNLHAPIVRLGRALSTARSQLTSNHEPQQSHENEIPNPP